MGKKKNWKQMYKKHNHSKLAMKRKFWKSSINKQYASFSPKNKIKKSSKWKIKPILFS